MALVQTPSAPQVATTSKSGAMSSTDKTKLDAATLAQMQELGTGKLTALSPAGWADARWKEMLTSEPTLTDAYPMLGIVGGMTDPSLPADISWTETVQGGRAVVTVDDAWHMFGPKLFAPATQPLAVAFRAKFPANNAAVYSGLGIGNVTDGGVHNYDKLIILSSFGAHAMTNFELNYYAGAAENFIDTTVPLDTAEHDITIVIAPTSGNAVVWFDGVAVVTTATSGKYTAVASMRPSYYSDAAGMTISKMMAGWKRP